MSLHDWDVDDCAQSSADEADPYALDPTDSSAELYEYLVDLKHGGVLSAKQACVIAWWASRAGAGGMTAELAKHPTTQSGHFSRHFDAVTGESPHKLDFMGILMPAHRRCDASRSVFHMPCIPPHEAVADEVDIAGAGRLEQELQKAIDENKLPRAYFDHIVVRVSDGKVFPYSMYVDGVPFSRTDGCLCFYMYNVCNGVRTLIACLRKSELCACGCRGWCSFYQVFLLIKWSFVALRLGEWPAVGPDGKALTGVRAGRAGQPLPKACLLKVKLDMMEIGTTFGFPTWAHLHNPCSLCFAELSEVYNTNGINLLRWPWGRKTNEAYDAACRRCEHEREVTSANWRALRANLGYDKRVHGNRGRTIIQDMPSLNLMKGDRLEPSTVLIDIGDSFDDIEWPKTFTFWRMSDDTVTHHRNPIFDETIGCSPQSMAPDWLHCLSLGVFKVFLAWLVHVFARVNIFKVAGTGAHRFEVFVQRLKADLFKWYRYETSIGIEHTRVQDITPSMFGSEREPAFGLHGSETNAFLLYATTLIERYKALLPHADRIVKACASLVRCYKLIKQYPDVFPVGPAQEFLDNALTHVRMIQALGIGMKPKHHQFLEMAFQAHYYGSPGLGATWTDESINKIVKTLASTSHRRVWHKRILMSFRAAFSHRAKRRKY